MVVGHWHGRLPGKLPSSPQGQPYNWHGRLPFSSRIITSTCGCLFTLLVFNVIALTLLLFLAQIRHTVRYLVIPTRTGLIAKMLEQETTPPRSRSSAHGCISGYVIVCNKMAWNGKHPLESASNSLLENFKFYAYACAIPHRM